MMPVNFKRISSLFLLYYQTDTRRIIRHTSGVLQKNILKRFSPLLETYLHISFINVLFTFLRDGYDR